MSLHVHAPAESGSQLVVWLTTVSDHHRCGCGLAMTDHRGSLQGRFANPQQVSITSNSSLILSGHMEIEALDLDGACSIFVSPGCTLYVKRLVVHNEGWQLVCLQTLALLPGLCCAQVTACRFASSIPCCSI